MTTITLDRGNSAHVTVDTTAAGHGWYIDSTPLDNTDDFLPTADPNIWKAKPGTAAAGKMDMLSVLLHEYGHVLGLEHSSDTRDFMAANLQPGERRLPTDAELSLMARLVADLKVAELSADSGNPGNPGHRHRWPDQPFGPTPAQRFASSQRLARKGPTPSGVAGEGAAGDPSSVHFLGAVNPTLLNGDFGPEGTESWVAEGAVAADLTGNTVTLSESPTSDRHQTHLAQTFMVNPGNRTLSFTVAQQHLQANPNGPSDAFEAALLDADTGLPLLGSAGTIDLTHSDALLNLQTNGTERLASGVRKQMHADGSATYTIDLPQALAGRPVLLSFDLIGFGAAQSSITLRDVRLSAEGDPIANDDAFLLDEDTAVTGNVLTNDLAGSGDGGIINPPPPIPLPSLSPVISRIERVSNPAHGTLTLQDDGSFSYMPEANYYGVDSFSYRFIDDQGRSSNTATVAFSIAPVNDAPIAPPARSIPVIGSRPYTFDPLEGARDIEGDPLTVQWVTQPSHGTLVSNTDGTYTYTADASFVGTDTFAWRVSDGELLSDTPSTVTVTVLAADTPLVAKDASLSLDEDGAIWIDFTTLADNAAGRPITATITRQPAHGTLTQEPDGRWRYRPAADFNGQDTLRFTLSDGHNVSNEAGVTFQIAPVNDAPTLADRAGVVRQGASLVIDPLQSAFDVDGDILTAALMQVPSHGRLVINANGSFSYTPDTAFLGADHFSWRVGDGQLFSGIATFSIDVAAAVVTPPPPPPPPAPPPPAPPPPAPVPAPAPTPAPPPSGAGGGIRTGIELFHTGWEGIADGDDESTLMMGPTLEGWTLITGRDLPGIEQLTGGIDGFEIWHTGDRMTDAAGNTHWVSAAEGGGRNWLELNEAGPHIHQTLGIQRQVQTQAGVAYTLSFDIAGRLGFGSDYTRIGVYVDGIKLASLEHTSPADALAWQQLAYAFTGTGGLQTIRIVTEAKAQDAGGRGMMIDEIVLTEAGDGADGSDSSRGRLAAAFAAAAAARNGQAQAIPRQDEGSAPMQGAGASLDDANSNTSINNSVQRRLTLTGAPIGSVLTDGSNGAMGQGTRTFTVTDTERTADVSDWSLSALMLCAPANYTGPIALQLDLTLTDSATGSQASTRRTIEVDAAKVPELKDHTLAALLSSNPFVSALPAEAASGTITGVTKPLQISVSTPMVVASEGSLQFTVAPPYINRSSNEEEEADRLKGRVLSDEWLREMEQAAKVQWTQVVGRG